MHSFLKTFLVLVLLSRTIVTNQACYETKPSNAFETSRCLWNS